jgi:hypothetical protein
MARASYFFRTPTALEGYVEAIDVENNEYGDCWDSAGTLVRLQPERRPVLGGWLGSREVVRVEATGPTPNDEANLRRALMDFLTSLGEPESTMVAFSTAELIARGVQHAGWR